MTTIQNLYSPINKRQENTLVLALHDYCALLVTAIIVIIRNWLGNPANFKGTNKDQKIYVGRSVHDPAQSFVLCSHTWAELRNRHVSIGQFLGH